MNFQEHCAKICETAVRDADRIGCGHATQGGGMPTHREATIDVFRDAYRVAQATGAERRKLLGEVLASALFACALIDGDAESGCSLRLDPEPVEPSPGARDRLRAALVEHLRGQAVAEVRALNEWRASEGRRPVLVLDSPADVGADDLLDVISSEGWLLPNRGAELLPLGRRARRAIVKLWLALDAVEHSEVP